MVLTPSAGTASAAGGWGEGLIPFLNMPIQPSGTDFFEISETEPVLVLFIDGWEARLEQACPLRRWNAPRFGAIRSLSGAVRCHDFLLPGSIRK